MINRLLEPTLRNSPPRRSSYISRTGPSRRSVDRRLLILFALIILPVLAGCTRNIGDESDGWNPPVSSDGVVYVGTKDGQVKAYIDDGSGNLQESWTFTSPSSNDGIFGTYNTPLVIDNLVYVSSSYFFSPSS